MVSAEIRINLQAENVAVYRFDPAKSSSGLLSSVTMEEHHTNTSAKRLNREPLAAQRESAWFKAAVKEALGMLSFACDAAAHKYLASLRYVRPGFRIAINSASLAERELVVTKLAVATKPPTKPGVSSLSERMRRIDLQQNGDASFEVYEVDWRTEVVLLGEEALGASEVSRAVIKGGGILVGKLSQHVDFMLRTRPERRLQTSRRSHSILHQPLHTISDVKFNLLATGRPRSPNQAHQVSTRPTSASPRAFHLVRSAVTSGYPPLRLTRYWQNGSCPCRRNIDPGMLIHRREWAGIVHGISWRDRGKASRCL